MTLHAEPTSPFPEDVGSQWLLQRSGKPMFIFAHQDDETAMAGVIQRVAGDDQRGKFVWWTNGDGPAPAIGADLNDYAKIRMAETAQALRRLGLSQERKVELCTSEVQIYKNMADMALGPVVAGRALSFFTEEAHRIGEIIDNENPDRVFVLAWQGGQPEHDLLHVMVVRAVRMLRQKTGRPIPIIQVPAYEYGNLWALRFSPEFHGDRRVLLLGKNELETKMAAFEAYPSQMDLLEKFRRVISVTSFVGRLLGRGATLESYLGREDYGVVDPDTDYTQSTHRFERLDYPFDDFEKTPIRFSTMVAPIAAHLLRGT